MPDQVRHDDSKVSPFLHGTRNSFDRRARAAGVIVALSAKKEQHMAKPSAKNTPRKSAADATGEKQRELQREQDR
jgi:hypothetical protein